MPILCAQLSWRWSKCTKSLLGAVRGKSGYPEPARPYCPPDRICCPPAIFGFLEDTNFWFLCASKKWHPQRTVYQWCRRQSWVRVRPCSMSSWWFWSVNDQPYPKSGAWPYCHWEETTWTWSQRRWSPRRPSWTNHLRIALLSMTFRRKSCPPGQPWRDSGILPDSVASWTIIIRFSYRELSFSSS